MLRFSGIARRVCIWLASWLPAASYSLDLKHGVDGCSFLFGALTVLDYVTDWLVRGMAPIKAVRSPLCRVFCSAAFTLWSDNIMTVLLVNLWHCSFARVIAGQLRRCFAAASVGDIRTCQLHLRLFADHCWFIVVHPLISVSAVICGCVCSEAGRWFVVINDPDNL